MRHHSVIMAACAVQALTPPTTPTTPVVLEPPPPLEILYKGDAFAIVAKPGGVPSHASEYIGKDYVVPLLQRVGRDAARLRDDGERVAAMQYFQRRRRLEDDWRRWCGWWGERLDCAGCHE